MGRIQEIRKEEKAYHDHCYDNYKLFESGSWLHKPVQTVMDLLPLLDEKKELNVLDLGSGVGRNAIPIAEWIRDSNNKGRIHCVDFLDSAINRLISYSNEFHVSQYIEPIKSAIEDFRIPEENYDLVVAVSSIEHVESEASLKMVLKEIERGTKFGGIACLIVNSDLEENDCHSGESLDVNMEVNLSTEKMDQVLHDTFSGWTVVKSLVKPLEYKITRDNRDIILKTNAITYVARK
ncbi:class I SAM-dependent methyltransferase [Paucisalibacillus sp. EB02]|uniref:class I SAM-dependent methyltransferase n=1 Tax=Paucisalibacillus sp. EB02 TaxID=1347087 RepID=UPI0005A765E6|nr:class I SAM-dependent methyltransferase [Paucisalibacillus sp. EB02]